MNCNNYFDMTDQGDSFASWQGLRGPAGPQGTPGAPGSSVELKGPVATTGDLPASAPASELWQVGTQAPYNGYFFNGEAWISLGPVAAGTTFTPAVSSAGVISWTNDGSLPNPEPVNIKGPQGQTGPAGPGVPSGGSANQVLKKQSATDYDAAWEKEDLGITGASVGDLVRISAVDANNKPTAFTKVPVNSIKCNKNLLDNWYFVGGGSQLGYGVFPVNQRGQAVYTGEGYYNIDRWINYHLSSLTINNDGITIVSSSQGYVAIQYVADATAVKSFAGKKLTASVLYASVSGGTAGIRLDCGDTVYSSTDISTGGLAIATGTVSANATKIHVDLRFESGVTAKVLAAKLEIGDTQTLAHQENGAWVLNELPDYAAELAKCQAYLLPISALCRTRTNIVLDNVLGFDVPVPVTMAKTPAIVGTLRVSTLTGSFVSGFTFDVGGLSDNAIRIRASKTSHGLTDGFIDSDAVWYLSAE